MRDPETAGGESSANAILDVMVAHSLIPLHETSVDEDQRLLLHGVPWSTYVVLADSLESQGAQLTYLEGQLEIMTKSGLHEISTKMIARLVELFCLERDIPLYGYREMTMRSEEKECGLEPDEWYRRGSDGRPPHVALEVIVSNPLLDKLEVYRRLGIREIWVYVAAKHAFDFLALRNDQYEKIATSELIPELDFSRILHYLQHPDQHDALKAFRDELRAKP